MLLLQDAGRKALLRVAGLDRHPPLENDRARVGALVDQVHGAAGHRLAGLERALLRREPPILRQERGVDVENPAPISSDEVRRQDPHVPREADEVRPCPVEDPEHLRLVRGPTLDPTPLDGKGRQPALPRPGEAARLADVGDDRNDLRVRYASGFDRVGDRLEVGSTTREEDRNAASAHRNEAAGSRSARSPARPSRARRANVEAARGAVLKSTGTDLDVGRALHGSPDHVEAFARLRESPRSGGDFGGVDEENHADSHVEHAKHLGPFDATSGGQEVEDRRNGPGAVRDLRADSLRQHARDVVRETSAGDVRHPVQETALEKRGDDPKIATVRFEQNVPHRSTVQLFQPVLHGEPHLLEENLPSQRVAVRVQSARRKADQDIGRTDRGAVQQESPIHDSNDRSCDVVFVRRVDARHFGSFAAEQRRAVFTAAAREPLDDALQHLAVQSAHGDVVEKEEGLRPLDEDVVDTVVDGVDAADVVAPRGDGDLQLRADAVGRSDQDRLAIGGEVGPKEPAETADIAEDAGRERRADRGSGSRESAGFRVDVHAGRRVARVFQEVCDYRFFRLSFRIEARRRLLPHAAAVFVLWPIASILSSARLLFEHPVGAGVPAGALLAGSAIGALWMAPEWLLVGICAFLLSVLLFSGISAALPFPAVERRRGTIAEPLLAAVAGVSGVALEYPAVLRHPALIPLRSLSVAAASGILVGFALAFGFALGWRQRGRRGALLTTAAAALLVLLGWRASRPPATPKSERAGRGQTVLFGIDSLSQTDDVSILREGVRRLGGVWYERPVPPGLLTNSVWPAIVMDRPVSETGVFLVFQTPDWDGASFNVVRRARELGCRTYAMFSSRITFYLGSEAGFEVDLSGPRGWLHYATSFVKDGSAFLPIVLPHLREIPGAITPANQTGTFSYDLRREVHSVLTAGARSPCAFIAEHLDYLHQTAYPRYSELTSTERAAVREARAREIRDVSLDWQPPVVTADPLSVEKWKLRRLQTVVLEEIERSGFLAPEKSNRLILFSDHGSRRRLNEGNFGDPRYHRVVFATFGVAPRDPNEPMSLLDIPEMIGLADESRPGRADPVVEYANATGDEWKALMKSARLYVNGRVSLDPAIVRRIGERLQGFRPYGNGGYFPAPLRRTPPA